MRPIEVAVPRHDFRGLAWAVKSLLGRFGELPFRLVPSERGQVEFRAEGRGILVSNAFFDACRDLGPGWVHPNVETVASWAPGWTDLRPRLGGDLVPILFGRPGFEQIAEDTWQLHADLLGSAFYLLARVEETATLQRDEHGRVPARASLVARLGFLERPLVDEYAEILLAAMRRVWPRISPKRPTFKLEISHDVDSPGHYAFRGWGQVLRSAAADLLHRGGVKEAVRGVEIWLASRNAIDDRDPHNTFSWIMDQVEAVGAKSTFYFLAGGNDPIYDGSYELGDERIRGLMESVHRRGHTIGLHPSYRAPEDPELMVGEVSRMRETLASLGIHQTGLGCRLHYLRWPGPRIWNEMAELGLAHDATLGFADHIGFRSGTAHSYWAFDIERRVELPLEVRPLVAMECSLMDDCYMGLGTTEAAFERLAEGRNACLRVGGTFSLLWHNSRLCQPEERALFESVLRSV